MVVAASYNQNDFIKSYLSLRKVVASYEQQRINAAKYDTPCSSFDKNINQAQYLLWAFENFECYTLEERYKVISKANRVAKNCSYCPGVSELEISTFLFTPEGKALLWQADIPNGVLVGEYFTFVVTYSDGIEYLIEL